MELLATVHWVATREGAISPEAALAQAHAWNKQKRKFTEGQVALAYEALSSQGWMPE